MEKEIIERRFDQLEKHLDQRFDAMEKKVDESASDTKENTKAVIEIKSDVKNAVKDINDLGIKNNTQHEEFYGRLNKLELINAGDGIESLKKAIKLNDDKTEINKDEIGKILTGARTTKIIFGVIVVLLGLVAKFL